MNSVVSEKQNKNLIQTIEIQLKTPLTTTLNNAANYYYIIQWPLTQLIYERIQSFICYYHSFYLQTPGLKCQ